MSGPIIWGDALMKRLKDAFIEKIKRIEKSGKFNSYETLDDFKEKIENQ